MKKSYIFTKESSLHIAIIQKTHNHYVVMGDDFTPLKFSEFNRAITYLKTLGYRKQG